MAFFNVISTDALKGRCRRTRNYCVLLFYKFFLKSRAAEENVLAYMKIASSFLLKIKDLFLPLLFSEILSCVFPDFCRGNLEKIELVGVGVSSA